ncbi:hypothetical protein GCM10023195_74920 [Actinoallomurus liliacearum]|uniref:Uncharacterized protein n=1 Tax=Actinoallomurus liliacearum TaxID=1080073 RepID=A0ABP8TWH0_9ACTN
MDDVWIEAVGGQYGGTGSPPCGLRQPTGSVREPLPGALGTGRLADEEVEDEVDDDVSGDEPCLHAARTTAALAMLNAVDRLTLRIFDGVMRGPPPDRLRSGSIRPLGVSTAARSRCGHARAGANTRCSHGRRLQPPGRTGLF